MRHPAANPVERVMKELGRLVRAYTHQSHRAWACYIKWIEELINNTSHETTGWSPREMVEGTKSGLALARIQFPPNNNQLSGKEVQALARINMEKKVQQRKQQHSKITRRKPTTFQLGEKVLITNNQISSMEMGTIKKFHLLYVGPYLVKKVLHRDTFVVEDEHGRERGTYNSTHLKKYHVRQ